MTAAVTMRCPGCGSHLAPDARDHRADPTCGWRAASPEERDEEEETLTPAERRIAEVAAQVERHSDAAESAYRRGDSWGERLSRKWADEASARLTALRRAATEARAATLPVDHWIETPLTVTERSVIERALATALDPYQTQAKVGEVERLFAREIVRLRRKLRAAIAEGR